jgi:hypothetical protein
LVSNAPSGFQAHFFEKSVKILELFDYLEYRDFVCRKANFPEYLQVQSTFNPCSVGFVTVTLPPALAMA